MADKIVPAADNLADVWRALEEGSGGGHRLIVENRKRDGAIITCEWFNTLLTDTPSFNRGIMSLVQDITQRAANEQPDL